MALPRDYDDQICGIARSLEVIGERWTLLIVRDAFYGVSRFSDFRDHLAIPRAVLTERLHRLVDHGILVREEAASGRDEYRLTEKGRQLWPTVWSLLSWGNMYYMPPGMRRAFTHVGCGGVVTPDGLCRSCGSRPDPEDLVVQPRNQNGSGAVKSDRVSLALTVPHRLFDPMEGDGAST